MDADFLGSAWNRCPLRVGGSWPRCGIGRDGLPSLQDLPALHDLPALQDLSPDRAERQERDRADAGRPVRCRKAGAVEGYSSSGGQQGPGITWDEATFREYIKDPKAKVPGTKMIFPGLKDDKRIDDLIAYLKQFDASGKKSAARTPPRPMRAAAAMRDQRGRTKQTKPPANTAQETFRRTR